MPLILPQNNLRKMWVMVSCLMESLIAPLKILQVYRTPSAKLMPVPAKTTDQPLLFDMAMDGLPYGVFGKATKDRAASSPSARR